MKALASGAVVLLRVFARAMTSAPVWFALLAVAGSCLLIRGVYVLAGGGWAMTAAGGLCLLMAFLVLLGMSRSNG